ncbi:MAG: radical SAM protein [Muribaculaceae bacterium]|nr:radical SAM protein [Muribaculaceae bacterium]
MANFDLMVSPYTLLFEENSNFYIFNTESLFFSKINEETYIAIEERNFKSITKDTKQILIEKRVLIPNVEKDLCYHHLLTRHLNNAYTDDTMVLIIAPTTACNFACPYCFEPKANPKMITPEVENKIIEYVNKQENIKKISLTWYGGEPLLAIDAIQRIYNRVLSETDKLIVNHEIISNTFLVNDDIINVFRDIKIEKIQVSLDGDKEYHDQTRFLKSTHSPTFHTIQKNIEKMAKTLPELNISIRVNINKSNWKDFVTLYHRYHGKDWHKNIGLYPGIIREDSTDGCTLKHRCFKISELLDLYLKLANNGVNVNLFPTTRFKGCMLQRSNAFIVGPEGELYKCWDDVSDPKKVVGSIMDNKRRNYQLLMKYMHECNPIREECRGCIAFPICDGGCGRQQYRNKYENGEFQLCSPYKDPTKLKKALLFAISENNNKGKKIVNI